MRSIEQKTDIENHFSPPFSISNALSENERIELISVFENSNEKIHKNTGPITVNLTQELLSGPILAKVLSMVRDRVGDFEVLSGFFFYVERPHVIHNDDSFEFPKTFKGITIPLCLEGEFTEHPELCFFDQYYLDGPAKFLRGYANVPSYYNIIKYDYDGVCGLTDAPFDRSIHSTKLPHLKYECLAGLSYSESLVSTPGNVLVFDAVRLHAASDFRKLGITSKLGISIFTKRK